VLAYLGRPGRREDQAMTVAANEFIRRFLLHVLPDGFHPIRPMASPMADAATISRAVVNCSMPVSRLSPPSPQSAALSYAASTLQRTVIFAGVRPPDGDGDGRRVGWMRSTSRD